MVCVVQKHSQVYVCICRWRVVSRPANRCGGLGVGYMELGTYPYGSIYKIISRRTEGNHGLSTIGAPTSRNCDTMVPNIIRNEKTKNVVNIRSEQFRRRTKNKSQQRFKTAQQSFFRFGSGRCRKSHATTKKLREATLKKVQSL